MNEKLSPIPLTREQQEVVAIAKVSEIIERDICSIFTGAPAVDGLFPGLMPENGPSAH
jgi:hypothetical protein